MVVKQLDLQRGSRTSDPALPEYKDLFLLRSFLSLCMGDLTDWKGGFRSKQTYSHPTPKLKKVLKLLILELCYLESRNRMSSKARFFHCPKG